MSDATETDSGGTRDHEFKDELQEVQPPERHLSLKNLQHITLQVSADLGKSKMFVRDILSLKRGSVVGLDKLAGETADVLVNGVPMARGEVVVMVDTLSVRISEVLGAEEKDPLADA